PGKKSSFYFTDFFVEKICGFAQSVADGPDELAWSDPTNATKGITGVYASVGLNTPIAAQNGLVGLDGSAGTNIGTSKTPTAGPLAPSGSDPDWALMGQSDDDLSGDVFTPDAGWSTFGSSQSYQQMVSSPISAGGTYVGPATPDWSMVLMLFKVVGASAPALAQPAAPFISGTFNGTHNGNFVNPVTKGNAILVILAANQITISP